MSEEKLYPTPIRNVSLDEELLRRINYYEYKNQLVFEPVDKEDSEIVKVIVVYKNSVPKVDLSLEDYKKEY